MSVDVKSAVIAMEDPNKIHFPHAENSGTPKKLVDCPKVVSNETGLLETFAPVPVSSTAADPSTDRGPTSDAAAKRSEVTQKSYDNDEVTEPANHSLKVDPLENGPNVPDCTSHKIKHGSTSPRSEGGITDLSRNSAKSVTPDTIQQSRDVSSSPIHEEQGEKSSPRGQSEESGSTKQPAAAVASVDPKKVNGLALAWKTKLQELDNLMSPDQKRQGIEQINDNDVVTWEEGHMGYDIIYGLLPGNVQFRDIVSKEEQKYNLKNKQNVVEVAGRVVGQVRTMNPAGRFLKKGDDGLWFDIGNVDAIKHTLRALKEGSGAVRQDEGGYPDDAAQSDCSVRSGHSERHGFDSEGEEDLDDDSSEATDEEMEDDQNGHVLWDAHFSELEEFAQRTGDPNPNKSKTSADFKIGYWLSDQRRNYMNGRLSRDQALRLHNLGCTGFLLENSGTEDCEQNYDDNSVDSGEQVDECGGSSSDTEERKPDKATLKTWIERFEQLVEYKELHGHCNPRESKKGSSISDVRLGRWLREQRLKCRNGKLAKVFADKLRSLGCNGFDGVGVRKDPPKPRCQPWERYLVELRGYRKRFGHCNPTQTRTASVADYKLARWLADQRKSFLNGNLPREKAETLREYGCTGFEITAGPESPARKPRCMPWESRYRQLQAYKAKYGHVMPRENKKDPNEPENRLGRWLREQKKKFHDGNLSLERKQRLVDLGCDGFEVDNEGVPLSSESTPATRDRLYEGQGLGDDYDSESTQDSQMQEPRFGQGFAGSDEKNVYPKKFVCNYVGSVVSWENRFQDLLAYKEREGHANPRRSRECSEADYKLGAWLSSQRVKFRGGRLESDRIQKLVNIGCLGFNDECQAEIRCPSFDEKNSPQDGPKQRKSWDAHYMELQAYRDAHGHAVPQQARGSNPELVRWLTDQRFKFRRGSLADEKAEKLRATGCMGFDGDEDGDDDTSPILEPNKNDVVCGRGGHTNAWPGNVQFRTIVQSLKKEYKKQRKHKKMEMAKGVVRQIRKMNPPGRFLREESNQWVEVGDELAIKKASQALREIRDGLRGGGSQSTDASEESEQDDSEERSEYDSESSEDVASLETSIQKESLIPKRNVMTWDEHFRELKAFKNRHGHVKVGCSRGPDYRLGHWLADQRYKYRKGDLNEEKSQKLYEMGCHGFGGLDEGRDNEPQDVDSSEECNEEEIVSLQSVNKPQPLPTRKRRLGVHNPQLLTTTTRAGRNSKKKKSGRDNDYVFY